MGEGEIGERKRDLKGLRVAFGLAGGVLSIALPAGYGVHCFATGGFERISQATGWGGVGPYVFLAIDLLLAAVCATILWLFPRGRRHEGGDLMMIALFLPAYFDWTASDLARVDHIWTKVGVWAFMSVVWIGMQLWKAIDARREEAAKRA